MFLFCVSVESRITQIGFVTVLAFVISPIHIILASTTTTCFFKALILVSITELTIVAFIVLLVVKHSTWHLNRLALLCKLLKIGHFIRSLQLRWHLSHKWVLLHHHLRLHLILQWHVRLVILLLLHAILRILVVHGLCL